MTKVDDLVLVAPRPPTTRTGELKRSPKLGHLMLEFSGVKAHAGGGADEPFNSDIGA